MRSIFHISVFTFKEGLRQRVLYGVVTFSCLLIILSVLACGMFMRDVGKVLLDICLSAVSLGGLMVPFFLAVNLLAGDLETRSVYSILSVPVSRAQYILGKYFGLSAIIILIISLLTGATVIALKAGMLIFSKVYFANISILPIIQSVLAAALGNMLLLACVFFWSSLVNSSFLTTLLTLATYLVGQTIEEIVRFMSIQTPGVHFSEFFKKSIHILIYIFPNLAVFDLKQYAAHGEFISLYHSMLLGGYSFFYSSLVLSLAILFFTRRDLP